MKVATVLAVLTDGEDNASRKHTASSVKELVTAHRKNGALCQFIAANLDSTITGAAYGFAPENTLQMGANPENARAAMMAVSSSTQRQLSGAPPSLVGYRGLERATSDYAYQHDLNGAQPSIFGTSSDSMLPPPPPTSRYLSRGLPSLNVIPGG